MIIIYPGYSFETLSTNRDEKEAKEILAAWSAAFHPALIERYDAIPRWESASMPPYEISKHPIVIPPCCESYMNEDWFRQQEDGGGVLIRNLNNRDAILTEIFRLEQIEQSSIETEFDAEFVADFQALGICYFLIDLLVRQLHYMSMMDDSQVSTQIFNSLRAYRRGEREMAIDHLKQAFEAVCQSKEYFYPIRSYWLDLVLLTPKTMGESFRTLLDESLLSNKVFNLFLPSKILETFPETEPESFNKLRSAATSQTCEQNGKISFIVDDTEPRSLLLLPILDAADRILEGISIYREKLDISPTIYGRAHIGLTPFLPQLLKLAGMTGAVHFAPLDGWYLKDDSQSKMIWQGDDGTKLDALTRYPLNALSDEDFFTMANRLGETINNDHSPTTVVARFPNPSGNSGSWLDALHRAGRYTDDLGAFSRIETFFEETAQCGGVKSLGFEKYPGNELTRAVEAGRENPISYWHEIYRESITRLVDSVFETVQTLLGREIPSNIQSRNIHGAVGALILNPWSFPRRVFLDEIVIDVPPIGYAFIAKPEKKPLENATEPEKKSKLLGLFRSGKSDKASETEMIRRREDDLGKNVRRKVFVLENEYFEAKIDESSGMLRSVFTPNSRFNRLSQQIGFRQPFEQRREDSRSTSDPNRGYAIMAADTISIESNGPVTGSLKIQGRLVCQDGTVAARFTETVTIRRRSRILEFDLSIEPQPNFEPSDSAQNPWDSYFGIRYAWNDNTLDLRACLGDGLHAISNDRLQSPKIVDLRGDKNASLTFFTEGLPFHRRFGERQLDTILTAAGETAPFDKHFRFGIGIDVKYPIPASLEFCVPKDRLIVPVSTPPQNPSAWLFQVEAKNVIALHWEPLKEPPPSEEETEELVVGFRVFLLETEGRKARFALHSFLTPLRAAAVDLFGEEIKSFEVEDDRVQIEMHGHELLPLAVRFR